MSPANFGSVSLAGQVGLYSGAVPSPLTTTLDSIGKVTLYLVVQNFLISVVRARLLLAELVGRHADDHEAVLAYLS